MKRPVAILLLVIMVLPPTARAGQVAARAADAVGANATTEQLDLLVGRSTVVRMERPITRVSLSTPDIADALVTTPYELLVHGKTPGTISLLVWGDNGRIKTYDVAVKRDLSQLDDADPQAVPGRGDHRDEQRQGRRARRRRLEQIHRRSRLVARRRLRREARERRQPASPAGRARRPTRCCCACGSPK